jgi:hypothetical protein
VTASFFASNSIHFIGNKYYGKPFAPKRLLFTPNSANMHKPSMFWGPVRSGSAAAVEETIMSGTDELKENSCRATGSLSDVPDRSRYWIGFLAHLA